MKDKKNKGQHALFWSLILAIIFGLFAGVSGDIIFRYYFNGNLQSAWLNQEWNLLDSDINSSKIIIQDAKKVIVSQDDKMAEVASSVRPSVFDVLEKADAKKASSTPYDLGNPLFRAFSVSSDGWLMAVWPESLSKATSSINNLTVFDSQRKQYAIDKVVSGSDYYPYLAFIHISGSSNLEVRRFASIDAFYSGQSILATDGSNLILPGYLYNRTLPTGELSSDKLEQSFVFSSSKAESGYLVFNSSGDFLGLVDKGSSILPAFALKRYWEEAVDSGKLSWPKLGIGYYDLSSGYIASAGKDKGALVNSIEVKSPAGAAGLEKGDIITYVDNYEVSSSSNLSDIISTYKPGSVIKVTYLRNNNESEVKVTLE